ncbi:ankyrin repeat domain-containing protein [Roseiconus nitratireducens]|uniref:Ankyrin repeat domain-containing protein n=1 Tax=Roseiconus nitratireducens TaxID=2605748 RepID=A0A5M6D099_9BACT|nr:ankyrin repeat domain-containing protein [Roseiconus nitratireducens]KAA5538969.1 ankyrin repeat domain-containing protein [Roseiconus nitratireducens]
MTRKNPLFQIFACLAFLTLFTSAGMLRGGTPKSVSSADQVSHPDENGEVEVEATARLYRALCELNENWADRDPNFDIVVDAGSIDDEVSLIQTHLMLVISELQTADIHHLSESQLTNRLAHIHSLRAYAANGNFPRNVFTAGRCPVFIDPWGTHCAVGHLIATSGHAGLANAINSEHQLDLLNDIKTLGLAEWQRDSGLSLDELALIQPTYVSTTLKYPKEIESLILGDSQPVITAIENGNLSVDARCGGKTLLHFAAATGDLSLVKLLVQKGADLQAVSELGCGKSELAKGGSQTVVDVRWNQSTSVSNRGGLSIGRRGPVFQTPRGQVVAGVLNDLHGGLAGMNALDYATRTLQSSRYGYARRTIAMPGVGAIRFKSQEIDPNDPIEALKSDRAAVAAWLKDRGLNKKADLG